MRPTQTMVFDKKTPTSVVPCSHKCPLYRLLSQLPPPPLLPSSPPPPPNPNTWYMISGSNQRMGRRHEGRDDRPGVCGERCRLAPLQSRPRRNNADKRVDLQPWKLQESYLCSCQIVSNLISASRFAIQQPCFEFVAADILEKSECISLISTITSLSTNRSTKRGSIQ
jgi:hypothetical protein